MSRGAAWARRWLAGGLIGGLVGCLMFAALGAVAQDVQPVPVLSARVLDATTTLSPAQHDALTAKLAALEQGTGAQVVVLMVESTQPEDIAAYAQRVGDAWKLGRKAEGDGALIVVAKTDRRVRIEVAKSLEGAVPDLAARQIITNRMTPAFQRGDYAGGLNAAVDALAARIKGEALPAPQARPAVARGLGVEGLSVFMLAAVPILAVMLGTVLGRKLGALGTAAGTGGLAWFFTGSALLAGLAGVVGLVVALVVGVMASARGPVGRSYRRGPVIGALGGGLGGGFGGGWGGSGGGGGGFGSGGGGDFGGGGASGNW